MSDTIRELRGLAESATPGPWRRGCWSVPYMVGWDHGGDKAIADADLIAAMRNALPALLDIAEAATRLVDEWDAKAAGAPDPTMLGITRNDLRAALSRLDRLTEETER